ncbi:MAG: cytochrome c oxidase subunit 3 [Bacteroidetes bacterium]|nr:cytochrome c oxidase subunit 3 [Bacteroidota bacterium]
MIAKTLTHINTILSNGHARSQNKTETKIPSEKILLWIVLASIIMLFSGLTSAYVVRQSAGNWVHFKLPILFSFSTSIILLSSLSMNWAVSSANKNNSTNTKNALLLTLVLGFGFVVVQYLGWKSLTEQGIFLIGNPSGSFLYVLTGLHVIHILAGLIALCVVTVQSFSKTYNDKFLLSIKLCSTYWHFVDGLWIYLFLFLLLVR